MKTHQPSNPLIILQIELVKLKPLACIGGYNPEQLAYSICDLNRRSLILEFKIPQHPNQLRQSYGWGSMISYSKE